MYKNSELLNTILYKTKEYNDFKKYLIDKDLYSIHKLIKYLNDNSYLEHNVKKPIVIYSYFIENNFQINMYTMTKLEYTDFYKDGVLIRVDNKDIRIINNQQL